MAGTPLDFHQATAIGARINDNNEQMRLAGGYDHNYVLNGKMGVMQEAARVEEPTTGRVLTVETTQPGVQFYSGNFLDGTRTASTATSTPTAPASAWRPSIFPIRPITPNFPQPS